MELRKYVLIFVLIFALCVGVAYAQSDIPGVRNQQDLGTCDANTPTRLYFVNDSTDGTCDTNGGSIWVLCGCSDGGAGFGWEPVVGSGGGGGGATNEAALETQLLDVSDVITDLDTAGGDLSGSFPSPSVVDDSHAHTTTTISGLVEADISDLAHTVDTDTTCLDAGVACLFAAAASEGGAATDLDCTGCVSATEVAADVATQAELDSLITTADDLSDNDLGDLSNVTETGEAAGVPLVGDGSGGWIPASTTLVVPGGIGNGVRFSDDLDTGFYGLGGANQWKIIGGNASIMDFATSLVVMYPTILRIGGGVYHRTDTNTGVIFGGADDMTLQIGGSTGVSISANGVIFPDLGTRPTCSSSIRHSRWTEEGGAGVADVVYVCLKSAADTYSWVTLVSG